MNEKQDETPKRPKRRWRYVLLAFLLLILIGGGILWGMHARSVSKLEAKLAAIRAAGYPVTPEELDKWYPQVPEDKNAAVKLAKAFSLYVKAVREMRDLPMVNDIIRFSRTDPLPPEIKTMIEKYLELNQKALPLLHAGAAGPECRYPIDLSKGLETQLPELGYVRTGVKLLYLDALNHAVEGRPEAASRDIVTMTRLARTLDREPLLISQIVRLNGLTDTAECAEQILNRTAFDDEQLAAMMSALESSTKSEGLFRAIIGERCMGCQYYRFLLKSGSVFENASSDSVPFSITPGYFLNSVRHLSDKILMFFYINWGWAARDYSYYLDYMTGMVDAYQISLPLRIKVAREKENGLRDVHSRVSEGAPIHSFLSIIPPFPGAFTTEARCLASIESARTAMAIERYRLATGKLPDSLNELVPKYLAAIPVDPFDPNARSLRYHKLKKGYVVYSVDEDGQDNGGAEKQYALGRFAWEMTMPGPGMGELIPGWKRSVPVSDLTFIVER